MSEEGIQERGGKKRLFILDESGHNLRKHLRCWVRLYPKTEKYKAV